MSARGENGAPEKVIETVSDYLALAGENPDDSEIVLRIIEHLEDCGYIEYTERARP